MPPDRVSTLEEARVGTGARVAGLLSGKKSTCSNPSFHSPALNSLEQLAKTSERVASQNPKVQEHLLFSSFYHPPPPLYKLRQCTESLRSLRPL